MTEIKPDVIRDCKGMSCPLPVLHTKKAIDKMEVGQILKMETLDPASWGDLQAWVQRTGNEMVDMKREEGGVHTYYIKKLR